MLVTSPIRTRAAVVEEHPPIGDDRDLAVPIDIVTSFECQPLKSKPLESGRHRGSKGNSNQQRADLFKKLQGEMGQLGFVEWAEMDWDKFRDERIGRLKRNALAKRDNAKKKEKRRRRERYSLEE